MRARPEIELAHAQSIGLYASKQVASSQGRAARGASLTRATAAARIVRGVNLHSVSLCKLIARHIRRCAIFKVLAQQAYTSSLDLVRNAEKWA